MAPQEQPAHHDWVRLNVRMLKRLTNKTDEQIGVDVGLSGEAFRQRLTGRTKIKAGEVADLAKCFKIPVEILFVPPDQLWQRLAECGFSPPLDDE